MGDDVISTIHFPLLKPVVGMLDGLFSLAKFQKVTKPTLYVHFKPTLYVGFKLTLYVRFKPTLYVQPTLYLHFKPSNVKII